MQLVLKLKETNMLINRTNLLSILVGCLGLIFSLFSRAQESVDLCDCSILEKDTILKKVLVDFDYNILYDHLLGHIPIEEKEKYAIFFGDYANDLRGYSSMDSPHTKTIRSVYYDIKAFAYGESGIYYTYYYGYRGEILFFKVKTKLWKDQAYLSEYAGTDYSNCPPEYVLERQNPDSLIDVIVHNLDTSSYQKLRYIVNSSTPYKYPCKLSLNDLRYTAKILADSLGYLPAAYDVYQCYERLNTYNHHPMSTNDFKEAHQYLLMGVDKQYLPCIWKEAILKLTGTYMPQDTIVGKRLFYQCIDGECKVPFWRYVPTNEPYKDLLVLRQQILDKFATKQNE